jgi:hypothetical protein
LIPIISATLQRLYHDWEARRRGREFPARGDFDVLELKYILGSLSLLDVAHDPVRFRFRVHGSAISERVGYEMTGKPLAELPGSDMREIIFRHYADTLAARAPIVQMRERLIADDRMLNCEVLTLPLARDGATIDMLMTGVIWL